MGIVPLRGLSALACGLCALCLGSPSTGDEWALPPHTYWSADRKFALWLAPLLRANMPHGSLYMTRQWKQLLASAG